jgi:hypothetical protein
MRAWWIDTGWPWLKANWWILFLLPVMALVWLAMRMKPQDVVVAPLAGADERAQYEIELRNEQLMAEKRRLANELAVVTKERDALRAEFEARLRAEVDTLRDDPEKLRMLMLTMGPGRPR